MNRIILVVTILLSLGAGVLSFLTKQEAENVLDEKRTAMAKSQTLEAEVKKLTATKKDSESKIGELTKTTEEHKSEAEKVRTEMTSRQGEIAKSKSRLKELEAEVSTPKINPETEAKLASLNEQLEKVQKTASEQEKRAEQLAIQLENERKKKVEEARKVEIAKVEKRKNALGRILAYDAGWSFVVFSLGDADGVTPESELEVQRGGQPVARLSISKIQPQQTTANLMPLPSQRSRAIPQVSMGDTVVFLKPPNPKEAKEVKDNTPISPALDPAAQGGAVPVSSASSKSDPFALP
jgi:myosin heavy subunit